MPPTRTRRARRQTKLDFSPKPKTSSSKRISVSSDESPVRSTKKRRLDKRQETERGMRLGMPVQQKPKGMFGSSDNEVLPGVNSSSEEDSESESEEKTKTGPPPRRARRGFSRPESVRAPRKEQDAKAFVVPQEMNSESEENSEEEVTPKRKLIAKQLPIRTPTKQRQKSPEEIEKSTGETEEEEDSDEDDIPRSTQRRRATKPFACDPQEQEDLEEDLEFLQSSPPANKDGLRSRHSRPLTEREKALESLKRRRASSDGVPSSSATPGRKRAIVLSDTDTDLEIIPEEVEDAQEDEIDDDVNEDMDENESEEGNDTDGTAQFGIPQANVLDMFYEDVNDADFIDDDPNLPIGVPAYFEAIPIEFTNLSRARPRELFKYAVEWMVHRKINPSFPRDDEMYTIAFRKLDDEINGLANSKFSSSAWTLDFTRALRARPDILLNEIGSLAKAVMSAHCEACNRKTHPASWEVSLTGAPYHKGTLEPLVEDSDSNSDSSPEFDSGSSLSSNDSEARLNGEKPTYNETGEQIPPSSKIFTLGSTCKANAEIAHALHHWRYHLNSWVVDYLIREGHCSPEKVIERDSWREKKREKYANKIVDKMEKEGEIKSLHKLYKTQVNFAFEAKNEYRAGWGRK